MTLPCLRVLIPLEKIGMETNKDADLRVKSNGFRDSHTDTIELELYDDLIAFTALAPGEQAKSAEKPAEEPLYDEQPGEDFYPEIVSVVESAIEHDEEAPFEIPEEQSPFEIVESSNVETSPAPISLEETMNPFDELIFDTAQPESQGAEISSSSEIFSMPDDDSVNETETARQQLSNTSPLDDAWSGVKIKTGPIAACRSCGNISDVEDMFCIACGEFLEMAEADVKIATTCADCDALIGNDDIVCPSCGSMVLV